MRGFGKTFVSDPQKLPRPANVVVAALLECLNVMDGVDFESSAAKRLINEELVHLVRHYALTYSIPGTTLPGSAQSTYEMPTDEDMLS